MRLSISTSVLDKTVAPGEPLSAQTALSILKTAGFDFVDLSLWSYSRKGGPLDREDWEDWAFRCRESADQLGIRCLQTHGNTLSGMKWDDETYTDAKRVWENNYRCIKATSILGADWMVMHPYNLPHAPCYSIREARERNLRFFAPFIDYAKKLGIGIAIENMVDFIGNRRRYCGGDPEELLELVDTINDPAVGICVDTGHANISGIHVGDFIRMAGFRLKCTHVDDNNRDADSHFPPFFGTVDWADTLKVLRDIGYGNDFSFEIAGKALPLPTMQSWCRFLCDLGKNMMKET